MNRIGRFAFHLAAALLAAATLAGCVTGDTPSEKFQSRMRAKAVPPSDFLPNHELLVKQPDHFPFHYFYLKKEPATYQHVHVMTADVSRVKAAKGWTRFENALINKTGRNADSLLKFTHQAFEQAFRNAAKESKEGACLEVTDRTDLPGTLIVEPAFIAIAPTRAEFNYLGFAASFFCMGTDTAASLLSGGSVTMECRVRDAKTGEIIAMYSDTEKDPTALVSVSQYTWTASTRINVKEIARQTAVVLSAKDYREVKRKFPIKFFSLIRDENLDKE